MESESSPYSLSDQQNSLADSDLLERGEGGVGGAHLCLEPTEHKGFPFPQSSAPSIFLSGFRHFESLPLGTLKVK